MTRHALFFTALSLLVLATAALAIDDVGPVAIANLSGNAGRTTVVLSWTAPADQNSSGACSNYDVRESAGSFSECNFTNQTLLSYGPPAVPGSAECMEIGGLTSSTQYHFAIRTQDAAGNWSVVSNEVSVTTLPPTSHIEAVCLLQPPARRGGYTHALTPAEVCARLASQLPFLTAIP